MQKKYPEILIKTDDFDNLTYFTVNGIIAGSIINHQTALLKFNNLSKNHTLLEISQIKTELQKRGYQVQKLYK